MSRARTGAVPEELRIIAREEGIPTERLRDRLASGKIVVLRNKKRGNVRIVGVGEGLRTKVNVNVGTSPSIVDLGMEVEKVRVAVEYGADSIMDLSTGGDLDNIRRKLLEESRPLPFGTVPIYQAYIEGVRTKRGLPDEDDFIKILERHLEDGVDFMTIHAGITLELAKRALKSNRIEPIVSRGGSMLTVWMLENNNENPYYTNWNYILELFAEYDAVISLGDALRPGALVDALDHLQIGELIVNAKLLRRAREEGVQVMVEGPGHVPLDKIAIDVKLMKTLTDGAPYYVLGPIVTDTSIGYDHISAAIGAAIAAADGADLICYLTPAEHLSLPTPEQVREGLIAAKIAAHAGDIVKLGSRAVSRDIEISRYKTKLQWDKVISLSIDSKRAREIYEQYGVKVPACNMCGDLCVFLLLSKYLKKKNRSLNIR
ncbi:MAG: phosphomethylpyrimidine synthase [Thermoprotei archaeon]|nr:MAG: phosphomethylpyrimidine synthase [Thermoprotei archaeon]